MPRSVASSFGWPPAVQLQASNESSEHEPLLGGAPPCSEPDALASVLEESRHCGPGSTQSPERSGLRNETASASQSDEAEGTTSPPDTTVKIFTGLYRHLWPETLGDTGDAPHLNVHIPTPTDRSVDFDGLVQPIRTTYNKARAQCVYQGGLVSSPEALRIYHGRVERLFKRECPGVSLKFQTPQRDSEALTDEETEQQAQTWWADLRRSLPPQYSGVFEYYKDGRPCRKFVNSDMTQP